MVLRSDFPSWKSAHILPTDQQELILCKLSHAGREVPASPTLPHSATYDVVSKFGLRLHSSKDVKGE